MATGTGPSTSTSDQGKIHVPEFQFEVAISEHYKSYITFPEATVGKPINTIYYWDMLDVTPEDPVYMLTLIIKHLNIDVSVNVSSRTTPDGFVSTIVPPIHGTYAAAVKFQDRVVSKKPVLIVAKQSIDTYNLNVFQEIKQWIPY